MRQSVRSENMRKMSVKVLAASLAAASGILLTSGTAAAEESALERYERISRSQGNLVQVESGSSRYAATSSIRTGSAGSGGSVINNASNTSGNSTITIKGSTSGSAVVRSGSSTSGSSSSRSSSTSKSSSSRSSSTSGSAKDDEEDERTEPGQPKVVEDSQITGPTVQDASISEQYYEDYGVYEENLSNTQFFYSTISNGGITDSAVSLEFPVGMEYKVERNGVEIPYTSGQELTDRGTYIVRLTVTKDDSLPFSQQTILKAVFRFRIQEKSQEAIERDAQERRQESDYGSYYGYDDDDGYDLSNEELVALLRQRGIWSDEEIEAALDTEDAMTGGSGEEGTEGMEDGSGEELAADGETGSQEELTGETEAGTQADSYDVMGEDGSVDPDSLDDAIAQAMGPGYSTEELEGYDPATGMASAYDEATGYYRHELASGAVFYTDVPDGMITNSSVMLLTNDDLIFTMEKDGEAVEYTPGTAIQEAGSYTVYPSQESTVYLAAYGDSEKPHFHFRIVNSPVNDIGIFAAPRGGVITEVRLDGELLAESRQGEEWLYLRSDGTYEIRMDTEAGGAAVTLAKDTMAPRFYVSEESNRIYFSYLSGDASWCRVSKDGNEIHSGALISEISDPGSYQVDVYDEAGNVSSIHIELPYRMNMAAVIVIVLVVILAAALVIFIRRTNSQLKVL